MNKVRKTFIIGVLLFLATACTPRELIKVRNALVCAHADMTNCVVHTDAQGESSISGDVCTEDMDCWNCHFMGNGICGPVVIDQERQVVVARNGTFPYTRVLSVDHGIMCVDGRNPIHPTETTVLACGKVK